MSFSIAAMPARSRRLRKYWFATGHRRRLTHELAPLIGGLNGLVLDVGGGRSAEHDAAWPSNARRISLDISAAHRPHVCADAQALPIADASVQAVTMFEVLEHVPDPFAAVREAHRALVDGGTLLGSAPFVWPIHGDPSDYFRFSADALRYLLTPFTAVHMRPLGNALGAAWVSIASRSRVARTLNPLLRRLGSRPDEQCPQGYIFIATK